MKTINLKPLTYFTVTGLLVLIAGYIAFKSVYSGIRIIQTTATPYSEEYNAVNVFIDGLNDDEKYFFIDYDSYSRTKFNEPDLKKIHPDQRKILASCLVHNKINLLRNAYSSAVYIEKIKYVDPDNGWYDMVLALLLLENGSPKGLDYYYRALGKNKFTDYRHERLAIKHKLFGSKPTYRNVLRKSMLIYEYDSDSIYFRLDDFGKKLIHITNDLINDNKTAQAEKLLDSYAKFLSLWTRDSSSYQLYCIVECAKYFNNKIPILYHKIKRPEKAKTTQIKLSSIIKLYNVLEKKCLNMHQLNVKDYHKNRSKNGIILDWIFMGIKLKAEKMAARRKIDYIISEKLVVMLLTVVLFSISMILFVISILKFAPYKNRKNSLLPPWKPVCCIALISLFLPASLWLFVSRIPALNGRDENILNNAWSFSAQCLILALPAIVVPWLTASMFSLNSRKIQKYSFYENIFISVKYTSLLFFTGIVLVIILQSFGFPGDKFMQHGLSPFVPLNYHGLKNPGPCIWCFFRSRAVLGIFALLFLFIIIEVLFTSIIVHTIKRKKYPEYSRLLFTMAAPIYALSTIFFYFIFIPYLNRSEMETVIKGNLLKIEQENDHEQLKLHKKARDKIINILKER
jgi:hypothetical protein